MSKNHGEEFGSPFPVGHSNEWKFIQIRFFERRFPVHLRFVHPNTRLSTSVILSGFEQKKRLIPHQAPVFLLGRTSFPRAGHAGTSPEPLRVGGHGGSRAREVDGTWARERCMADTCFK